MKFSLHLVLILAYLVGLVPFAGFLSYGEVEPAERIEAPVSAELESTTQAEQAATPAPTEIEPSPRISMEFQEADIRDVLKVLAQQAGISFIIGRGVRERRVTLFLRDVTIEDALDAIMEAAGLAYEWVGKDCIIKESELKDREGG